MRYTGRPNGRTCRSVGSPARIVRAGRGLPSGLGRPSTPVLPPFAAAGDRFSGRNVAMTVRTAALALTICLLVGISTVLAQALGAEGKASDSTGRTAETAELSRKTNRRRTAELEHGAARFPNRSGGGPASASRTISATRRWGRDRHRQLKREESKSLRAIHAPGCAGPHQALISTVLHAPFVRRIFPPSTSDAVE